MTEEEKYIRLRCIKAFFQSIPFYLCRIFRIKKTKIVFTSIEGTTGYACNPKYIAEEFLKKNRIVQKEDEKFELVWLVNDKLKKFPKGIKVYHNGLWNRAYQLSTAKFWIDNSRKQLEVRKRNGQIYIQTWHAKIGLKPTCLDRGASFSEIAYLVSKHDSDMVDYWLSNSDWYDKTLPTGSLYEGKKLRTGSPRCDALINDIDLSRRKVREKFKIPVNAKILMYAPTFRGGSQSTRRSVEAGGHFPDYKILKNSLERRFGGVWYVMLRRHPQIVARNLDVETKDMFIIDGSHEDDIYEMLAGCDAFLTDYSSAAFDASVMKIPVFLYADDYQDYVGERGNLLWDLRKLPFLLAENNVELEKIILGFDEDKYLKELQQLFNETGMVEDGCASRRVVEWIINFAG